MLNTEDFIENYISICVDRGISSPKAICEEVLKEMKFIDEKIRETNQLRIKYKNYKEILKKFNHESTKKIKLNNKPFINDNSSLDFDYFINLKINICNFIEKSEELVTSREIIDSIGSLENNQDVYICIKDLADNGILERNDDRKLHKGKNWNNRPI